MCLQRCEVSVIRPVCWRAAHLHLTPPSHRVYSVKTCLLRERVQLQGKPLSKVKFLLMLCVAFVFAPLRLSPAPPPPFFSFPCYVTPTKLKML